jgi:hypothetical protein
VPAKAVSSPQTKRYSRRSNTSGVIEQPRQTQVIMKLILRTGVLLLLFISIQINAQRIEEVNLWKENYGKHQLVNESFSRARLIVTGENHSYVRVNRTHELKLMRYLNSTYGVNDFLMEQGYAIATLANRYIHGDTSFRKTMYALTSYPYFLLFDSLRIYNNTVPAAQQISIHGIDLERTVSSSIMLMDNLLPSVLPSDDSLLLDIETIRSLASRYINSFDSATYFNDLPINYYYSGNYRDGKYSYERYSAVERSLKEVLQGFDRKRNRYKNYLGSNFGEFEKVVGLLDEYRRWDDFNDGNTLQSYLYREEVIYKNMKDLMSDTTKKYFGQFGRMHVARCIQNKEAGYYNYRSFIVRLVDNDPALKGRITSIGMIYEDDVKTGSKGEYELSGLATDYKNEPAAWLTTIDKNIYPETARKFDFVIVNKKEKVYNAPNTSAKGAQSKEVSTWEAGITYTDDKQMQVLNQRLGTTCPQGIIGINMNMSFLAGNNIMSSFGTWVSVNAPRGQRNDSVSVRFSRGSIYYNTGYNFYPFNRLIVAPYVGIAYGFASIDYILDKYTSDSVSFSRTRVSKVYGNNAFVMNTGLNVKFFIGNIFYVTAQGNYAFDGSKKNWTYWRKGIVSGFPGYTHGGLNTTVGFGFAFE